jgi:hypothetical protein
MSHPFCFAGVFPAKVGPLKCEALMSGLIGLARASPLAVLAVLSVQDLEDLLAMVGTGEEKKKMG